MTRRSLLSAVRQQGMKEPVRIALERLAEVEQIGAVKHGREALAREITAEKKVFWHWPRGTYLGATA